MDIGKFTTIGFLGKGAFGSVFRAKDTFLDVERAIKIIQARDPQEFMNAFNEAQILERCRHNHIVDIKEVDIQEVQGVPSPCIVTEYLRNGSAQNYIENHFVSTQHAVKTISECLFGLEHAHSQGILHRDIKPGNILYADNGEAKLSDFGLAYGLSHQVFDFEGYSSHLAPEVLDDSAQDELSDLYSMGVTLHRMLNNLSNLDIPFANDAEWLRAVRREQFPQRVYLPHVPTQIIRIANKAIKADRDRRYQTCLQFRQALQGIQFFIEWNRVHEDKYTGLYMGNTFEIELYHKRTGYCIDFTRNGRKDNTRSYSRIPTLDLAKHQFYQIIQETTISLH